jgi:hypothetical protein
LVCFVFVLLFITFSLFSSHVHAGPVTVGPAAGASKTWDQLTLSSLFAHSLQLRVFVLQLVADPCVTCTLCVITFLDISLLALLHLSYPVTILARVASYTYADCLISCRCRCRCWLIQKSMPDMLQYAAVHVAIAVTHYVPSSIWCVHL